jgi:hypothetical protein
MSVADCNIYSSSHKGEKNFKVVNIKWYWKVRKKVLLFFRVQYLNLNECAYFVGRSTAAKFWRLSLDASSSSKLEWLLPQVGGFPDVSQLLHSNSRQIVTASPSIRCSWLLKWTYPLLPIFYISPFTTIHAFASSLNTLCSYQLSSNKYPL